MHIASSRGHLDCVRYLLDARAEIDVPNDAAVGGNTPLHLAIMRHYTNVAMLLLHAGADFDLVSIFLNLGQSGPGSLLINGTEFFFVVLACHN